MPSLVADAGVRANILAMIETELALTREMVLKVSGGNEIAERFPDFRAALEGRLPTINEVNREQVELLRRFRGARPRPSVTLKNPQCCFPSTQLPPVSAPQARVGRKT